MAYRPLEQMTREEIHRHIKEVHGFDFVVDYFELDTILLLHNELHRPVTHHHGTKNESGNDNSSDKGTSGQHSSSN